ncbi:nucleotidyltransferase family protein [Shimia sp. W99]|uniref:CTP:molybdopterin cytidylyltransferase MocA n=1 Tax=Shimia aestuarii TaxID=254406 RepID=A0A1I4P891_9RHOB|nr:nucleotidyltransferase family protein [Shimia aestuarii]SFM24064.1 CTP:molybdopterin cytidylyltransferase MocA [Shimia aestuarii]
MLTILLLAAGRSSRMRGADKLLQDVNGTPQIATMAKRAQATGCPVAVCLPPEPGERHAALSGLPVLRVPVDDADLGMAHSIRAGIAALPADCTAALILPADMPEITRDDLMTMIEAHNAAPTALLQATSADGIPGHPVIFPENCFGALKRISGDTGARPVLRRFQGETQMIPLPGTHALTDLDTPEDWAAWRARP